MKLKYLLSFSCFVNRFRGMKHLLWTLNSLLYGKNHENYFHTSCCCKQNCMKSHHSFFFFLVTDRLRNINMVMKTSRLWKKKKTSHALRFKRSKKLILLLYRFITRFLIRIYASFVS